MNTDKSKTSFLKDYYFVIIPILIIFILYSVSLTYGFRNFDEDLIIQNFYTKKTLGEYIEKYFLVDWHGITQAQGFAFSSIKNVHFCILERPVFYLINFLFQSTPFLFHLLSLLLHCLVTYFFIQLIFNLCQNKQISMFSGLIWAIHPTNVEPVVWATNWPALVGAVLYFYTLNKVSLFIKKGTSWQFLTIFISVMSLIQILFVEHTITIPIASFLIILFQMKLLKQSNIFKTAIKSTIPSFIISFGYLVIRIFAIEKNINISAQNNFLDRVIFLSPQVFLHQLNLILLPLRLTIDQIDLLKIDKSYWGLYHVACIFILVLLLFAAISLRHKLSFLSLGIFFYMIGILPFIQIAPLYSVVAERYNYFGSTFLIFGIVSSIYFWLQNKQKLILTIFLILSLCLGTRSFIRVSDWKDSKTLFLSTANTSNSLLKKGIWTYNLALSEQNENKKEGLLNLSTNLLNLYLQNQEEKDKPKILLKYELDSKSLLAKAALRISTNYEILNQKEKQFEYLIKALNYSITNSQLQGQIFKNLGTYHFQKNESNKAINYYEKSNKISPSPTMEYAKAICYLKQNNLENYEKHLLKATCVISAYNVGPFKTYGQFLELQRNDLSRAIKYYKIASLLENNPEPYILLATAHIKLNDRKNTAIALKNGLHSFPNNPELLYINGSLNIAKGKNEAGIKDLIKVINNEKTKSDMKIGASQILVNIFLKEKNVKEAIKYNDTILALDPANHEALKNKDALMIR